jgi:hypothetical protein
MVESLRLAADVVGLPIKAARLLSSALTCRPKVKPARVAFDEL